MPVSPNLRQLRSGKRQAPKTTASLAEEVKEFFDKYANEPEDKTNGEHIGPNGMLALLNDIGVPPTDRMALVLAWKLCAETQCEFSWEEFREGMTKLKAGNVDALKKTLPSLNTELEKPETFSDFYDFAFGYAKSAAARSLDAETAAAYWSVVFQGHREQARAEKWISFVSSGAKRAVTRDMWTQLLEFLRVVKADLSNYDENASWPSLIDDYVVYLKKHQTA